MRAKPSVLLVIVEDRARLRQVVERTLLEAFGVSRFEVAIRVEHALQRFEPLPLGGPATPVRIEIVLRIVHYLLL